VTALAGPGVWY